VKVEDDLAKLCKVTWSPVFVFMKVGPDYILNKTLKLLENKQLEFWDSWDSLITR
jgi:hypothetical protein